MRQLIAMVRLTPVAAVLVIMTGSLGMAAEPAGGKFDGTWETKAVTVGASTCRGATRNATISSDKFSFLWNPSTNMYLTGTVDAAGTLQVADLRREVTGTLKYDGNKFAGDVSSSNCTFGVEMKKK